MVSPCVNAHLLMLDYDGTLTPITKHYQEAQLSQEGIERLRRLSRLEHLCLAIVSGRSVEQLRVFLKALMGEPIYLVGLHGGELYDMKTGRFLEEPDPGYKQAVVALTRYLQEKAVDRLQGIALEEKGYSLGVHYREASAEDTDRALTALKQGLEELGLTVDFILRPGKKLLEAVPNGFNKGVGVTHLLQLLRQQCDDLPDLTYIGDDITDFDAFKVINRHQGRSIYVGETLPPEAPVVDQILPDVDAVHHYLESLLLPSVSHH